LDDAFAAFEIDLFYFIKDLVACCLQIDGLFLLLLGLFFIFQKGLNTEIDVAFAGRVFIDN
jgi:hypothetical protein